MPNVIHIDEVDNRYGQEINIHVMDAERGPQGEQGEPGQAATIEAGNAYAVDNGTPPAVMNVGTDTNAKFDFYIPKGDKGDQGEPGVVQYKAGRGIRIIDDTIYATGIGPGGGGAWGEIIGDIEDQTDLQQEFANYTPTVDLATVALSGSYNDLSDTPVIPTPEPQIQSDWTQTDTSAVDYIKNKPTIPTVNNATLTIQQNGVNKATFTANSATNATANITSPVITLTDTDPGEDSSLATNNYVGVYGDDPIIMDYSTSEINTGAKWIDGKPIYRRAFTGTITNTAGTRATTTLWSSSTIDTLVDTGGEISYGEDGKASIPQGQGTEGYRYVYLQTGTHDLLLAVLYSNESYTNRPYKVWVEYTKNSQEA